MKVLAFLVAFAVWTACFGGCAAKAIESTALSVLESTEPDEEGPGKPRMERAVMRIEERSVFDQLSAIARLTGDIARNDIVGAAMDGLILAQILPLHPALLWMMRQAYKVLSFIHPAFWWLFPSTKPANVKGAGFRKVSFF